MNASARMAYLAVALLAGPARPVAAHHSVAGAYDFGHPREVAGVITRVAWINPHVLVELDANDGRHWTLETAPIGFMRRAGVTKDMILGSAGEKVVVTLVPPRSPARFTGILNRIRYADGHEYKLGVDSRPDSTDVRQ